MKKLLSLLLAMLLIVTSAIMPSTVLADEYGNDVDMDIGGNIPDDDLPDAPDTPAEPFSFSLEPTESGVLGGYVTETSTTVTAVAYDYSTFLGWFNKSGALITTDTTINKSASGYHGARFSTQNLIKDSGFEGYVTGSKVYDHAVTTKQDWTFYSGATTTPLTAWGDLYADGAYKLNGKNSLKMRPPFQNAGTNITLKPNTEYLISFNCTYTVPRDDVFPTKISYGVYFENQKSQKVEQLTVDSVGRFVPAADFAPGTWVNKTFTFTTGDTVPENTVFAFSYSAGSSTTEGAAVQNNTILYIDDIVVMPTNNNTVNIEINAKNNISVVPENGNQKLATKNKPYGFKVITQPGLTPTVTAHGQTLTADANGLYTFTPTADTVINISCGSADNGRPAYGKDYFGRDLTQYNAEVYAEQVWKGDTLYHETALFMNGKDTIKLLYPVDEVISLRSYSLQTQYVEGVDYEITSDGCIKVLPNSRIPVYSLPRTKTTATSAPLKDNPNEYITSMDDIVYTVYAVNVTYKHSTVFEDGYQPAAPEVQNKSLDGVLTKLKNGQQVNIVVVGDSISCGWNCSGMFNEPIYSASNTEGAYENGYIMGVAPYMPTWANMLVAKLNEMHPGQINFKNLALSGKTAKWGADNITARLSLWKDDNGNYVMPDLMLIGFGVNDSAGNVSTESYKLSMQNIVINTRYYTNNQNLEALYYSPMMPNQLTAAWDKTKLLAYENALEELAAEDENIAVAKLTSVFDEIIKSKAPEDYLNTYWNHGNDFTGRMYLTTILYAMFGDMDEAAPEVVSTTHNTVTLKGVDGYEYSVDGVNWQSSPVFTNLNANTSYNFVCRKAETAKAFAGFTSAAATVTTAQRPTSTDVPGNINGDDAATVDLDDVVALAQVVAGWQNVVHNPDRCDVNGDGEVTLDDVVLLAQYVAGWDVKLAKIPGKDIDVDVAE